jgi:hypothetical protein
VISSKKMIKLLIPTEQLSAGCPTANQHQERAGRIRQQQGQNYEQAREDICEEIGPEVLYTSEVLKYPHTLRKLIQVYLVICGLQYTTHPERNRIIWGLPAIMYQGADLELAYSVLIASTAELSAVGGNVNNSGNMNNGHIDNLVTNDGSSSGIVNNALGTGAQIAQKMAMRVAKSETKFTGDLNQSYTEFISNYQHASKEYELTPTQKLQYLYLLSDGEAKQYYRNYCYALLRMRPLSISCTEGFVVISCGKVDYDKSGWRDD